MAGERARRSGALADCSARYRLSASTTASPWAASRSGFVFRAFRPWYRDGRSVAARRSTRLGTRHVGARSTPPSLQPGSSSARGTDTTSCAANPRAVQLPQDRWSRCRNLAGAIAGRQSRRPLAVTVARCARNDATRYPYILQAECPTRPVPIPRAPGFRPPDSHRSSTGAPDCAGASGTTLVVAVRRLLATAVPR